MEHASAVFWNSSLGDIEKPSNLVLAADYSVMYYLYFTYAPLPRSLSARMHDLEKNIVNMAFVDGHVAEHELRDGKSEGVDTLLFNDHYQLVRPGYFE